MSHLDVPALLAALKIPVVRQAGEVYWCCCPLHGERTPSWFIRERPSDRFHGAWHCYGCKESGWPVQLVQKVLSLATQKEAFDWLRTMPEVDSPLPQRLEVVTVAADRQLRVPDEVCFDGWPDRYRDYLVEDRHMTWNQVQRWGLGYIDRDSPSELADRVYLPAEDGKGRLLSYTCRAVGSRARRRYREPRREEGASDAAVFGERFWSTCSRDVVVVVEGAFNALAVERAAPFLAVAALMGSSLHPLQVMKLARYPLVLLATDPDKAGEKAATELRGALARYTQTKQLPIPAGQDCDSMPIEQLTALLARALP